MRLKLLVKYPGRREHCSVINTDTGEQVENVQEIRYVATTKGYAKLTMTVLADADIEFNTKENNTKVKVTDGK